MEPPAEIQSEEDLPVAIEDAPRAALNTVAEVWPEGALEPDSVDTSLATKIAVELESEIGGLIESFESETALSHREAQVYVLTKMIREGDSPLSNKAIGLYLVLTDDADDYITPQAIQTYAERVGEKVSDARQTLLWVSRPNHEVMFDNPEPVWLEDTTVERLKSRAKSRNVSVDTLVQEHLDSTEEQLDLRELVTFCRDELGAAQVAVEKQSVEMGGLNIIVHTGDVPEKTPKVLQADVIAFNDETFEFHIDFTMMGPQNAFRITLFADQNIRGMDPVSVDDGLNALREKIVRGQN